MKMTQKAITKVDLIVFGKDGYELHKTLISLVAATPDILEAAIKIVISAESLTPELQKYLSNNEEFLEQHSITTILHPVSSLEYSKLLSPDSTHTVLLTAGDCVTARSLRLLLDSVQNEKQVAYPQADVRYFKNQHKLNVIHENIDFPTDPKTTALAAWQVLRFAHFLVLPSAALRGYSSPSPQAGYGYGTWHLITTLISEGYSLSKVPNTAVFTLFSIPEKDEVLPYPSALYSAPTARELLPQGDMNELFTPSLKDRIKDRLSEHPTLTKGAQKSLHYLSVVKKSVKRPTRIGNDLDEEQDEWLISEAAAIHRLNANVFLTLDGKFQFQRIHESLGESLQVGAALTTSLQSLRYDSYDYVLLVPWLIAGGADMFFINYANSIAEIRPDKKVLIVSTEPSRTSLSNSELGLSEKVDFLHLAEIVGEHKDSDKVILYSIAVLVDLFKISTIHAGLSRLGYKYIDTYRESIKSAGRKIVLTGYNEIITDRKRREGYVHDIIPAIYDLADVVTTDNNEIAQLWRAEYGLNTSKVVVHHQPFFFPDTTRVNRNAFNAESPVRVLWASHMRKEKNPTTYADIARALSSDPAFTFMAYGALDKAHYRRNPFTHKVGPNMAYGGSFKSFFKEINPDRYDVFVYTSLADGTPNILIEAGLAELPIISSKVGGIGKLIGGNGALIDNPKDTGAFVQALKDFKNDPTAAYHKAAAFKKEIIKHHTAASFNKEVEAMLTDINY